jgi:hypothetical protein
MQYCGSDATDWRGEMEVKNSVRMQVKYLEINRVRDDLQQGFAV